MELIIDRLQRLEICPKLIVQDDFVCQRKKMKGFTSVLTAKVGGATVIALLSNRTVNRLNINNSHSKKGESLCPFPRCILLILGPLPGRIS